MIIDVSRDSGVPEAIGNLEAADADLQARMMDQARQDLAPTWRQLLNEQIRGQQDASVIAADSQVAAGRTGFGVYAAQSSAPLSGGLTPLAQWQGIEFGARTRKATFLTHSRKGKAYMVTKFINRGLPSRQKFGQVGFKAASEMGTALVGTWMAVMVSLYRDAVGDTDRG